jgi:hypothetical protein
MQNNFDLKGYLRNNKLLNESLGGYVDLKPMKEMDLDSFVGAQKDTADFQGQFKQDIKTVIDHIKDGYGVIGSDYVQQAWEAFSDIPFDTVEDEVFAELLANDVVQDTRAGQDLGYDSTDSVIFDKGWQYDDDDINEMESDDDQYDGVYDAKSGPAIVNELKKPENIYADEEDSIEYDSSDRMMDLGGQNIEQNIISLIDDGFDPEDVLEMCKMFIDAHSQAAMQGNKF